MPLTIAPGGLVVKDPSAERVYIMDWSTHLATGVEITTSTWSVSGADAILTTDNPGLVTGNRKAQVRLLAGTVGVKYTVTNRIVTNESPTQTDERSFRVLVQNR